MKQKGPVIDKGCKYKESTVIVYEGMEPTVSNVYRFTTESKQGKSKPYVYKGNWKQLAFVSNNTLSLSSNTQ